MEARGSGFPHGRRVYSIEFWMGYEPQTFELGAVYVENFHDELPELSQLGGLVRYDGWEPNADWRTEADARIDRYRKADLKVRAIDAAGNALKGASVKLRMLCFWNFRFVRWLA